MAKETVTRCDVCKGEEALSFGEAYTASLKFPGDEEASIWGLDLCERHGKPFRKVRDILTKYGKKVGGVVPVAPPKAPTPPITKVERPKPAAPSQSTKGAFFNIMRKAMIDQGITYLAAEKATGINRGSLASLKNYSPNLSKVQTLTEYLHLNYDEVEKATGYTLERREDPTRSATVAELYGDNTPPPLPVNAVPQVPVQESLPATEPAWPTFYAYVADAVKAKGYLSVEAFAVDKKLSLSTLENLRKRLPRGVTLQILSEYLGIPIKDCLEVYADLKKHGAKESEDLALALAG